MIKPLYLPKYEMIVYFGIYLFYLLYAIYHLFILSDEIKRNAPFDGFESGWKILGRPRDNMDFEWKSWKINIYSAIPWFALHVIFSELARIFNIKTLPLVHAVIGNLYIYFHFNLFVVICFMFKNLLYFWITARFRSSRWIWTITILWLLVMNFFKSTWLQSFLDMMFDGEYGLSDDHTYEVTIIFAWNLLKCISFSFDKIRFDETNPEGENVYRLIDFLGYAYYFPNMFLGPLMIYDRHKSKIINWDGVVNIRTRVIRLIGDLLLCGFWLIVTDFCLHYIYINNLLWNPQLVEMLNPWALYGMYYVMGQFFNHKYIVTYGLGIALAKWDNIDTPNKPKCISRIHLYSDMWKYFDQGLYEFLLVYIYKNLIKSRTSFVERILASFMTFAFIYLWHGVDLFILIWTASNYLCLVIELTAKAISRTELYKKYFFKNFVELRTIGLLGSQLFIPSAISTFYFFAGTEVGNIFVRKTYVENSLINYALLTICCTSIYHTSEFIKRYEKYYANIIKKTKQ